jgi:tetratricopeptide (TPR) repeat protein
VNIVREIIRTRDIRTLAAVGDAVLARGSFIGRDPEMQRLDACLEQAIDGTGQLVLLVGEPGIGKTRTADELLAHARTRGARVATAVCHENAGAPAFWLWRQVLAAAARLEPQSSAPAVDTLWTDVSDEQDLTPAGGWNADEARFRLFTAVATALRSYASSAPLVVLLDDLHWADRSSLLLLRFVAAELRSTPIMLLGTYRAAEMRQRSGRSGLLAELARVSERIPLQGFTEAEVASYVSATLDRPPDPRLITALHRASDGNPFFVQELMRLHRGEARSLPALPDEVRDLVRRRVDPLPDEVQRVLAIASVLGDHFDVGLVARVSERSEDVVREAIDAAQALDLVRPSGDDPRRYRFAHGLLRETLYCDLPAGVRATLHRRAGEAIEGLKPAEMSARLPELAHHFFHTAHMGNEVRAVQYGCRAGDRAMRALAYEEAVRIYERALHVHRLQGGDDAEHARLLIRLGDALWRSGDGAHARDRYRQAAALARATDDPQYLAQAAISYGMTQVETGAPDPVLIDLLEEALARIDPHDRNLASRLRARLTLALYFTPHVERRLRLSEEAIALAREALAQSPPPQRSHTTLAQALLARRIVLWGPGQAGERLKLLDEAIAHARRDEQAAIVVEGQFLRVCDLLEEGDIGAVDAAIRAFERLVGETRLAVYRWHVTLLQAMRALHAGRLNGAEALIFDAYRILPQEDGRNSAQFFVVQLFTLRREQGRLAELDGPLDEAASTHTLPIWKAGRALADVDLGRRGAAMRLLEALAGSELDTLPRDTTWVPTVAVLAEVAHALGARAIAERLHALLAPYAREAMVLGTGAACWGSVARYVGLAAAAAGRSAAAVEALERAIVANARMGARPQAAHAEIDLAEVLIARGQPGDADAAHRLLARARETARELGLVRVGTRAAAINACSPAAERSNAIAATLRREGDFWTLEWNAQVSRVKDSDGLAYLARLLSTPGRAVAAIELVGGRGPSEGEELVDGQARSAYRERLEELREELDEAERCGDVESSARARAEQEAIAAELARAVGLGGRARHAASPGGRARVNVTRAITRTLRRLRTENPGLARYLALHVKTGFFCRYEPDGEQSVTWRL